MSSALSNIFSRLPVSFTHGQGVWLWDADGRRYLDALSGIGVNSLGHAHPRLVAAITEQAQRVIHVSNLYEVPQQAALAERLVALSGLSECIFTSSGSEANETALKLARYYGHQNGNPHAHVITMDSSWHGRTLATLAATGSAKAREGFEPLPAGYIQVAYNSLKAIEDAAAAEPRVNTVLLETLQGEGGIRPAEIEYLQAVRRLCDERGWLFMIDEVQSGIGRTGKWFAHQWADIRPDVMTLAKGLGGGVPIGATLMGGRAAGVFKPGSHGTTFGGNPLVCHAALTVLQTLEDDGLLESAHRVGTHLQDALRSALAGVAGVNDVRGRGLMIGIELDRACGAIVRQALETGLLVNVTRDRVVRLLPPLILTEADADEIVARLVPTIKTFLSGASA